VRELCALLLTIVYPAAPGRGASASVSISPAAAASMLLGASVALMLCGSVTFAIGFFLMPWVAGLALLFGFAAPSTPSPRGSSSAPTPSSPRPLPPRRSLASTRGDGSSGPRPQPQ
ncbi:hypothetical protein SORBI_3003G145500, partial [Sorghum bicolor]